MQATSAVPSLASVTNVRRSHASWLYGAMAFAGLAYFLLDLPVQVTDSFGNMLDAREGTFWDVVSRQFFVRSYLRPLLWAHIRVLLDLADGHYYWVFRGWHVIQIGLLITWFLIIVRPRDAAAAAAVPVGLAALIGMHTFSGTIREAFPVNTFMTILLCCFGAAALSLGPARWWRDVAAFILFVFAALTVESGLLVWVVFVSAWMVKAPGLSRWGILAQFALLAGYFYLRFVVLQVGSPTLEERSSGYGFSSRDPAELIASFGGNPLPFYAYNVLSSVLTVFFGEPRSGVWLAVRDAVTRRDFFTVGSVLVVACTLSSLLIVRYVWRRRREWLARRFDRGDQIVFVFFGVTAANAVISYPYTKDVIMSPAGAFFGVALTVALCDLLKSSRTASVPRVVLAGVIVSLLSVTWAVALTAAHFGLRQAAEKTRADWAYVDGWLEREGKVLDARAIEMKRRLEDEAIVLHPMRPPLQGDWIEWMQAD